MYNPRPARPNPDPSAQAITGNDIRTVSGMTQSLLLCVMLALLRRSSGRATKRRSANQLCGGVLYAGGAGPERQREDQKEHGGERRGSARTDGELRHEPVALRAERERRWSPPRRQLAPAATSPLDLLRDVAR